MGTARTSAFSHLLNPEVHEIFFNKFSQWPSEYTNYMNVSSTSRAYEDDGEVAGLGKMVPIAEGAPVTFDDPFQSELKRYTPSVFGLGFRVTYLLYINDQHNVIKRMPGSLARSAHQTIEVEACDVFNYAFNTGTEYLGLDGKPLCATDHPNVAQKTASGPYSNRLSTDADLSLTSLQSMCELLEGATDDRDLNLMIKPKMLVIDYTNKWMARELLGSEKKPHTGDNEINPLSDEDLTYMVSHFTTDSDAWFLLGSKDEHYLRFIWREKLKFDNDDDFDTGDAKFKATMIFDKGFSGWRGVCGTSGA